jgi:hypothetical protein
MSNSTRRQFIGCGVCGFATLVCGSAGAADKAPPKISCISPQTKTNFGYKKGDVFGLTEAAANLWLKTTVDVCLDRKSFLDRGWKESQLGKFKDDKGGHFSEHVLCASDSQFKQRSPLV